MPHGSGDRRRGARHPSSDVPPRNEFPHALRPPTIPPCPRPPPRPAARGLLADWRLEDRCLLATTPYAFPAPTVSSLSQVMYDGVTGTYTKTITITNNDPTKYLYAFLEGENTRQAIAPYRGTAAFDPYDPSNQEYRGYVGFTEARDELRGPAAHDLDHDHRPAGVLGLGADHLLDRRRRPVPDLRHDGQRRPRRCPVLLPVCQHADDVLRHYRPEQQPADVHPDLQQLRSNGTPVADTSTPVSTGLFSTARP